MFSILAEAAAKEFSVLELIGGLAMFLFGMDQMSHGLKASAGDKLRNMLGTVTKSRVRGLLTGTGVTSIIQSSSATTVIVIGLINAGLLSLVQSIPVILGANIGTTFTIWIVAIFTSFKKLKITKYALLFVAIGFGFNTFSKKPRTKHIGIILLALGLIFIGLDIMKDSIGNLGDKKSSPFIELIMRVGDQPILCMIIGAFITAVIQSSSASVSMLVILVGSGAFGSDYSRAFMIAIPFMLGANIGTTVTAQLAALRANRTAKRAAMVHTLFNVAGAFLVLPLVYANIYPQFIEWLGANLGAFVNSISTGLFDTELKYTLGEASIKHYIALAHTMFNLIAAIVVLPMVGLLASAVMRIIPKTKAEEHISPAVLEEHLLDTPEFAIAQVRQEIVRMIKTAGEAVDKAVTAFSKAEVRQIEDIYALEDATDEFQRDITRYLVELSKQPLDPEVAGLQPVFLHSVNDIERIGDHATNIADIASRKADRKYDFGTGTEEEIERLRKEVLKLQNLVIAAMENDDKEAALQSLEVEGTINELERQFQNNHIARLNSGECHQLSGLIYHDFIQNMEKIADHLANVAQGILSGSEWPDHMHALEDAEQEEAHLQAKPKEDKAEE